MDFPVTLIDLAGFIVLLFVARIWCRRASSARSAQNSGLILGEALKTRPTAFLAGMGVTAVLQCSTAPRWMVSGFAAGVCRQPMIAETLALIVLKKTSRPARATTISWTPSPPIVMSEWRRVQPACTEPRASVNAGLTRIRSTPLRRRAGRVCQRPANPCGAR